MERLLSRLSNKKIGDVEALIRFHEILLFLSAYPQSARIRHSRVAAARSRHRVEALSAADWSSQR